MAFGGGGGGGGGGRLGGVHGAFNNKVLVEIIIRMRLPIIIYSSS